MLKLKTGCENCDKLLPAESTEARICSYECTFCADCVEKVLQNVCPNCAGVFECLPVRPLIEWVEGVSLKAQPAAVEKTYKPVVPETHADSPHASASERSPPEADKRCVLTN